jgi:hypothetical protein
MWVAVDWRISRTRCTSHVAATAFDRILAAFGSRLLASARVAISRTAWRPPSPIDKSGLLAAAVAATVGISTWKACAAALWLASIEVTAASTYDFHATHDKKLLRNPNTRPFRIPNMYLYMSFRVAQDHKAAGRDMTLSKPSSTPTQQEDPTAMT